jgi:hypothetical protein
MNRRGALRYKAADVPWITTVKLVLGGTAQLVDISRTGILTDTKVRLGPGRRNCVLLRIDDSLDHRIDGVVARAELVTLAPPEGPLYRTALAFSEEFDLRLPEPPAMHPGDMPVEAEDPRAVAGPHLAGPFDAIWASASASELAAVTNITEVGCLIETSATPAPGDWASVTIYFSEFRPLQLTGRVASVVSETTCALRFSNLTAEQCRALRVEIRARTEPPRRKVSPLAALSDVPVDVRPTADLIRTSVAMNQW